MSNVNLVASSPLAPLVALQAASQSLARVRVDEHGILAHLQEQIALLLPRGRIHMILFLGAGSKLYAWDEDNRELPPSYFDTPAAQGIVGWLRETKESLLVGDFERDWDYLPAKPSYHNPEPPRSAIFVPLVVGDEALGALSVQSDIPDCFTSDHLWQLKILANQMAAALSASRLVQSERLRANQLQTLAEVTRSVVSILDVDALLSHVVDLLQSAFGYYHVQIFIVEKGADRAVFRASSGDETHDLWRKMGRSVRVGWDGGPPEGMIGWVAAHGEPLLAPDVSIDPLYVPDDPRLLPHTRSEVAVPLRLKDEVLGVLDVQSDRLSAFTPDDLSILTALADAVALAIANARLYARVQEDAWITVALLEVADATNRLTELDDVAATVVRVTPLLTGVQAAVIWILSPDGVFTPRAQVGVHEETVSIFFKQNLNPSEIRFLGALAQGQLASMVMRPPLIDEVLPPVVAQALLADAVVFLPLFAKGEMIGALSVSLEEQGKALNDTRLHLLKGIANQSASAIENAQLIAAQREEAWVSTALLQVAEAMGRASNLTETLDVVARLTTTFSGLERCTILLRHGRGPDFRSTSCHCSRHDRRLLPPDHILSPADIPLLAHQFRTHQLLLLPNAQASDMIPAEMAQAMEIKALASMPLVANDTMVGLMWVDDPDPAKLRHPRLLDILTGIAHQSAVAIERARLQQAEIESLRITAELVFARSIQEGFLPVSAPQIPGYELAAMWEPAHEIAGDFYDFISLPDDCLGIVVADVADKGIAAALYMALSRTSMRLVATKESSPAAALRQANTAILDNTYADLFVTVYYAIIDPVHHQVQYASGGHGLALQLGAKGVEFRRGKGMVLGVFPDLRVEDCATTLTPGDYLIIYTDGVTDALNSDEESFDEDRLVTIVERSRGLPAQAMLDAIREEVLLWQGRTRATDDFTLVVVRRLETPDRLFENQ